MAARARLLGLNPPTKIEAEHTLSANSSQAIAEGAAMFDERLRLRAAARGAQLEAQLKTIEGEKPHEAAE
jgi:hypothetical protein